MLRNSSDNFAAKWSHLIEMGVQVCTLVSSSHHRSLANRSGGSAAVRRSLLDHTYGAGDIGWRDDEYVGVISTAGLCLLWQAAGEE